MSRRFLEFSVREDPLHGSGFGTVSAAGIHGMNVLPDGDSEANSRQDTREYR